eukprot:CAMPEP_0198228496 /NCGR_PEP_ID=MMETSP1445-20131203/113384_1 /TAXON_ID=36898 /ORGANISM="Pyramimonas sp., Strain CCMP2087" /LENGTH=86 /DNA_ID=CAMNT_0043908869 /DNA_START=209 /DNA_END=466 /DNA_ORIENTATION=-
MVQFATDKDALGPSLSKTARRFEETHTGPYKGQWNESVDRAYEMQREMIKTPYFINQRIDTLSSRDVGLILGKWQQEPPREKWGGK